MGDSEKHCHAGERREELEKTLRPVEVLALALGAIVGWGCFVLPGIRFLPDAGPIGTIIAFFVGALFQCIVALSYSFLIKPYPVAGGAFAYAYAGFGTKGAFICGWALVLSYICVIAANAMAMILLTRYLLPGVFDVGYLYTIAGWDINAGELAFVSAVLVLFGWMNFRGMSAASAIQVFLAFALTIGVLVLTFGTIQAETSIWSNLEPFFAEDRSPLACVLMVLALTPWLYVGFDTIPQTAEEFTFSPHKARDLMLLSIICGAIIYALVTLCVAGLIPYKELLAPESRLGHRLGSGSGLRALGRCGLDCAGAGGHSDGHERLFHGHHPSAVQHGTQQIPAQLLCRCASPLQYALEERDLHPGALPHRAVVRPRRPDLDRGHVRHRHGPGLLVHQPDRLQISGPESRHPRSPLGQARLPDRRGHFHHLLYSVGLPQFSGGHQRAVVDHALYLGGSGRPVLSEQT